MLPDGVVFRVVAASHSREPQRRVCSQQTVRRMDAALERTGTYSRRACGEQTRRCGAGSRQPRQSIGSRDLHK